MRGQQPRRSRRHCRWRAVFVRSAGALACACRAPVRRPCFHAAVLWDRRVGRPGWRRSRPPADCAPRHPAVGGRVRRSRRPAFRAQSHGLTGTATRPPTRDEHDGAGGARPLTRAAASSRTPTPPASRDVHPPPRPSVGSAAARYGDFGNLTTGTLNVTPPHVPRMLDPPRTQGAGDRPASSLRSTRRRAPERPLRAERGTGCERRRAAAPVRAASTRGRAAHGRPRRSPADRAARGPHSTLASASTRAPTRARRATTSAHPRSRAASTAAGR
jgi:hypothetical protein